MIRILSGVFTLLLAGQSYASELCDDLWFSRNLVFDQAGYCFGSPLGQAVFDNSDCTTNSPSLNREAQAMVAWIKDMERLESCQVDTSRTTLQIPLLDVRRRLEDPVVLSLFQSACFGWRGASIPLRAGYGYEHEVIGYVQYGDDVHWAYEWYTAPEGWDFLAVKLRDGTSQAIGWTEVQIDPDLCDSMAG